MQTAGSSLPGPGASNGDTYSMGTKRDQSGTWNRQCVYKTFITLAVEKKSQYPKLITLPLRVSLFKHIYKSTKVKTLTPKLPM